jgi:hypothetical protein
VGGQQSTRVRLTHADHSLYTLSLAHLAHASLNPPQTPALAFRENTTHLIDDASSGLDAVARALKQ